MKSNEVQIGYEYWIDLWPTLTQTSLTKRRVIDALPNGNFVVGNDWSADEVKPEQIKGRVGGGAPIGEITKEPWWKGAWGAK